MVRVRVINQSNKSAGYECEVYTVSGGAIRLHSVHPSLHASPIPQTLFIPTIAIAMSDYHFNLSLFLSLFHRESCILE